MAKESMSLIESINKFKEDASAFRRMVNQFRKMLGIQPKPPKMLPDEMIQRRPSKFDPDDIIQRRR